MLILLNDIDTSFAGNLRAGTDLTNRGATVINGLRDAGALLFEVPAGQEGQVQKRLREFRQTRGENASRDSDLLELQLIFDGLIGGGLVGAESTVPESPGFAPVIQEVTPERSLVLRTLEAGQNVTLEVTPESTIRIAAASGGGGGAIPTQADQEQPCQTTVQDGDFTGASISFTPASQGRVAVFVTGIQVPVAGASKAGGFCYFSGDGGVTARALTAIQAGDGLYWLGSEATAQLSTSDRISLGYTT